MKEKKKGKEILKVLGISALAIGVFTLAFIGINNLAFDNSTNTVENLPPVAQAVVVPEPFEPPEDFVEPELTVVVPEPNLTVNVQDTEISVNPQEPDITVVFEHNHITPCANTISPEEAAIIGAQYIWQMFGESIDGKHVTLQYSSHPSNTRAFWIGAVTETTQEPISREMDINERTRRARSVLFSFSIDAITGEWIDIFVSVENTTTDEAWVVLEEMRQNHDQGAFFDARLNRELTTPLNTERHTQIAKEHASRHFVHSEVVSVEFNEVGASGFDLDENGYLVVTSHQLMFEATDSTGRTAHLAFDEATGNLFYLMTMHNDFVPGFRYEISGDHVEGLG